MTLTLHYLSGILMVTCT